MSLRVNWHGQERAREMIEHGKVRHGVFKFDDEDERSMLGQEGTDLETHSAHHLGVDYDKPPMSKSRHRYPMGKEGHVYTRALHGIRNAAHEAGHGDIRDSASALLGHIKSEQAPDERHIVKDGKEYKLYTKSGHKLLGTHKSQGEAEAQEEAIKASEAVAASEGRSRFPVQERRMLPIADAEVRVRKTEAGEKHITGYAAKFNKLSYELPLVVGGRRRGVFQERIAPKAFDKVVKADVMGLKNHSSHHVLGRTKAGTMELRVDGAGLLYDITVPETVTGRDAVTEIERGDIDGSSFRFMVDDEGGDEWDDSGDILVRTILSVRDLFDVGPVVSAAYPDATATVSTRSFERFFESRCRDCEVTDRASRDELRSRALYRQRLVRLRQVFPSFVIVKG